MMWLLCLCILLCPLCCYGHICPKKCICEETKSMQCFRVQSVPSGIPRDVKKLNLGYNHFKELKVSDFSGLPGLEEVVLSSCGLEQVEPNTFRTQRALESLDLQKNKLRHIPRGLPLSLEVLQLGHNRIPVIQGSLWEGMRTLRLLNLQNNQIPTFRANTVASLLKLEYLNLDGNVISTIQGAPKLPSLNLLSLKNNRISSLPSSFFKFLQSLRTLDLSGNLLMKVPHDLPRALVFLNFDRNQIRILRSRDMMQLRNLTSMSVSYNRLVSVDGNLRLPNLTVLELAGNQLRVLPGRLSAKLESLDCGQNYIQEVTHQQLSGMRHLKHLFLENNTIRQFEANALKNCVELTNLALEKNLLSIMPEGLPETLVRLDLKGNHIKQILEHELKPLRRLQVLNLRNNRLSSLPAMRQLPRLRTIYLDGNPWNCSCKLLQVKMALLAREMEISHQLCNEPSSASVEAWRAHFMEQNKCKEDVEEAAESQTEQMDNDDYDDYDM